MKKLAGMLLIVPLVASFFGLAVVGIRNPAPRPASIASTPIRPVEDEPQVPTPPPEPLESPSPSIRGAVWTFDGRPIGGALVSAFPRGDVVSTEADGTFRLPGGERPARLAIRAAGRGVALFDVPPSGEVIAVLAEPGSIRGSLVELPPAGFGVRLRRSEPGGLFVPAAAAEFRRSPFEISGLLPGRYEVRIEAPGFDAAVGTVEVFPGAASPCLMALPRLP